MSIERFFTIVFGVLWLVIIFGCQSMPSYRGRVEYQKENGFITQIFVYFPGDGNGQKLQNREEVEIMEQQLLSMIKDLQYFKDQMRIIEPTVPTEIIEQQGNESN